MKWTMSDEYAAVITTVILAVLLVGTVQAYTLFKAWGDGFRETSEDLHASVDNVVQAVRTGVEPPAEDLAKVDEGRESNRIIRQKAAALMAAFVWFWTCVFLVAVQIMVLKWSATHSPKEDPDLAKFAFVVCAVSIVILVVEGVVRVMARFAVVMRKQIEWSRQYTAEDRHRYDEALRAFRQARQTPPSDPAT
jgi:hypothetical protein